MILASEVNSMLQKKLLVLGNGFDLYHGLPTKYTDFLFFAKNWSAFFLKYDEKKEDDGTFTVPLSDKGGLIDDSISEFAKHGGYNADEIRYLNEHINCNPWIEYFEKADTLKDNWIDFEAEMLNALKEIEWFYEEYRPNKSANEPASTDFVNSPRIKVVNIFGAGNEGFDPELTHGITSKAKLSRKYLYEQKKAVLKAMKNNMNCLNQCLRIYLSEFVSRIKVKCCSEQVKAIGICNVLNFNYTYTYQTVYDQREGGENHAIHGELKEDNLVLGVADDAFGDTNDYFYFTKYFQRLQKKTGAYYSEWLNYRRSALEDDLLEVHIFGHSLGKSDEEIFSMIFNCENVGKIYIYYHKQSAYEDEIINLIQMLGRKRLVSENLSGRIEFVQLKEAVQI